MNTKQYLLSAWNWSPAVIGACVAASAAYAAALRFRFPARSWYFIGALAVFFLTLTSPLNALAGGYLFSAHMLQHMLLLLIVPLLLPGRREGLHGRFRWRGRRPRTGRCYGCPVPVAPPTRPAGRHLRPGSARA